MATAKLKLCTCASALVACVSVVVCIIDALLQGKRYLFLRNVTETYIVNSCLCHVKTTIEISFIPRPGLSAF